MESENNSDQKFSFPPELENVPVEYSMTHITYEDVQGILSLVDIALERGSIKGAELTVLNQIRNDCLMEVQDFQNWQQKRNQYLMVEAEIQRREQAEKEQAERESIKATAEAKVQAATDANAILQTRIAELEAEVRGEEPPTTVSQELQNDLEPIPSEPSNGEIHVKPSKAFENARAQNPVPVTATNMPTEHDESDDLEAAKRVEAPQSETTQSFGDTITETSSHDDWDEPQSEWGYDANGSPIQEEDTKHFPQSRTDEQMEEAWSMLQAEDDVEVLKGPKVKVVEEYPSVSVDPVNQMSEAPPLFDIKIGQDGNVPLGEQPTEEDNNMNVVEFPQTEDDFEEFPEDEEQEIELKEDPESVEDVERMISETETSLFEDPSSVEEVQKLKEEVEEEEYEEIVVPNSLELAKMTKSKIKSVGTSLGFEVSDSQTKDSMIKDFEQNAWALLKELTSREDVKVSEDENIIRDGGYFGEEPD